MGIFNWKKEQKKKEQGVLTLYSVTLNSQCIYETVKSEFGDEIRSIKKTDSSLELILKDDTNIKFSMKDDKDFVKTQTNGMANYFSQAPLANKKVLEMAIFQICIFTCITGISFEAYENRIDYIVDTVFKIAQETHSFVLYPNMQLYTDKGKLLISISGETDFEEYYPTASSGNLKREAKPTANDEVRYKKIIKECDEKGIPYTSFMLGSQIMEQEVVVRSVEEIAKRVCAVFSCALYAECLLVDVRSIELAKRQFQEVNKVYGVSQYLSEDEKEYFEMNDPDESISIQFSWQYERCAVLLWALELMELNPPTQICDVVGVARTLRNYGSIGELVKASSIRSNEDLLDMHTRVLYYNWACVEARVKNQEMPAGLDKGVVQEQHYALNWLIGANGKCEWDDISTNT